MHDAAAGSVLMMLYAPVRAAIASTVLSHRLCAMPWTRTDILTLSETAAPIDSQLAPTWTQLREKPCFDPSPLSFVPTAGPCRSSARQTCHLSRSPRDPLASLRDYTGQWGPETLLGCTKAVVRTLLDSGFFFFFFGKK
ncbi:hypothetical protein J3F83DRAFT_505765 [Trichoderma novae-zelandiae]